jgi:hypothetical protein
MGQSCSANKTLPIAALTVPYAARSDEVHRMSIAMVEERLGEAANHLSSHVGDARKAR